MSVTTTRWRSSVVDQVGDRLRGWILRQGLQPGDRLPGYRQLARELDVAYMTVKRGVDGLAATGCVKVVPRKGLFVVQPLIRKPKVLHHALLAFPNSLHHVMSHVYTTEQARGVLSALEPDGFGGIRSMHSDGVILGDAVDRLNPDAVIMVGVENDEYLQLAANWGRPLAVTDYCSKSVPADCVACDNRAATRHCLEYLARLGHRRVAYLGGSGAPREIRSRTRRPIFAQTSSDTRERREGVLAAAAACGLTATPVIRAGPTPAPHSAATGFSTLETVFGSTANRPTALLLESDLEAPATLRTLAELGLRVPDDVSVCAVAGAAVTTGLPALTYCRFDFFGMGRKAVEALREQIARPGAPSNRIHRIGFEFVEGQTVKRVEG